MNRRSLHSSPPEVLRFSGSPPRKRSKRTDSQPSSLRPPSRPHPSHVSSPHHCAVLTSGAGCRGVGRQCQVRGELPGQMQHGAVRRDAALRTDRPGRLRLLSGLCGGQRGALLPHRVGDARGEVRTWLILRVLQGRGRLRGRIRDLQRCVHMQRLDLPVVGCFCLWAALWLCDALLHQMQHVITVFLGSVYWIITSDSSCIIAMWVSVEEAHEKMCPSWFNLMIRSSDAWIFHQFAFLCVYLSHFSWSLWFGAQIRSSHTPASPPSLCSDYSKWMFAVFTDCLYGTYGVECRKTCSCKGGICDRETGACLTLKFFAKIASNLKSEPQAGKCTHKDWLSVGVSCQMSSQIN